MLQNMLANEDKPQLTAVIQDLLITTQLSYVLHSYNFMLFS